MRLQGRRLRRQLDLDPYQPLDWDLDVGATLWTPHLARGELYTDVREALPSADQRRTKHRDTCYALIDQHLHRRGLAPGEDDRERLAKAFTLEMQKLMQPHQAFLLGKVEASHDRQRPLERPTLPELLPVQWTRR